MGQTEIISSLAIEDPKLADWMKTSFFKTFPLLLAIDRL